MSTFRRMIMIAAAAAKVASDWFRSVGYFRSEAW